MCGGLMEWEKNEIFLWKDNEGARRYRQAPSLILLLHY
jgi:hypothetical protein